MGYKVPGSAAFLSSTVGILVPGGGTGGGIGVGGVGLGGGVGVGGGHGVPLGNMVT